MSRVEETKELIRLANEHITSLPKGKNVAKLKKG